MDDNHPCECKFILSESYMGGIAKILIDDEIPVDTGLSVGCDVNYRPPLEEAKANARLMWAAPDLLDALLALDAISTDYMRGHNPKEWALLDLAIKKAGGRV